MFAEEFVGNGEQLSPKVGAPAVEIEQSANASVDTDLLNTIEAQLSQSEVYLRAVDSLQQLTADHGFDGQILLKAVSLEAVRLTLEAVETSSEATQAEISQPDNAAADSSVAVKTQACSDAVFADSYAVLDDAEDVDDPVFAAITSVVHAEKPRLFSSPFNHVVDRHRLKRQHAVEEVQEFTRAEILSHIGSTIQFERERQGLSIAQLHARTFIPMYHLQALEAGHVEQLPEDIYLRGFLRRIENALGLKVDTLTDKMPSDLVNSTLPCWSGHAKGNGRRGIAGLEVNPTHLYVTYAAIMAGGVYWLSQQVSPMSNVPALGHYEPYVAAPKTQPLQRLKPKSKLTAQQSKTQKATKSMQVGSTSNIAPPEVLR